MFEKEIDELKYLSWDYDIKIEEYKIYNDIIRRNSNLLIKYENIIMSKWHLKLGLDQSVPELVLAGIAFERLDPTHVLHFPIFNKKIITKNLIIYIEDYVFPNNLKRQKIWKKEIPKMVNDIVDFSKIALNKINIYYGL